MKLDDECMDDVTWADLVDDLLLDEAEDGGVPEPEASESGWHRAQSFDPEAIF